MKPIKRAFISVSNKDRLIEIGTALHAASISIVATGSTAQNLRSAAIAAQEVSSMTGFPEVLDGRVKSLHSALHAGILADQNNPEHLKSINALNIQPFDLVIVNLYPFVETVASGASESECIEQIDIGGPTLIRAAAKNHTSVAVITEVDQYDALLAAIARGGFTDQERRKLAQSAFRNIAEYDIAIANWMDQDEVLPQWLGKSWRRSAMLRYGENPHQKAALYLDGSQGIAGAQQLHGKEMSFNNYADADWAWRSAHDHTQPCVAIIKHANPCGIAIGRDIADAYQKAHACDPTSAFGAIVAANQRVTVAMAEQISEIFTEVIIAPGYEGKALEILQKKSSLRILQSSYENQAHLEPRPISGGALVQERDVMQAVGDSSKDWKQVTGAPVSAEVMDDLLFAWRSVRSVKSNAIVLAVGGAAVGIGMGQVNRLDSARLAIARAGDRARGSVAASDAFFPFADGLQVLIDGGVTAVVQPGGSIRDNEVIAAAESAGIAMFFTGARHFSHA